MEVLGLILMIVGIVVSVVGGLWFLGVAFGESVLWGLACLFIPFAALFFLISHWDEAGKPFLVQLAGAVPMVLGMAMTGSLGA
jgi:hypothetical protein